MPQEMPKPQPMETHAFIDLMNTFAINLAGPFLPALHSHCGSHAFHKMWPCVFYMLFYAGFANAPEIVSYIPVWFLLLIFRRITHDRGQESTYRGWPWLAGIFCRRERTARLIEATLVLAVGYYLEGPIGGFFMLGGAGLYVTFWVDSMVFAARKRAMQDAYLRSMSMARMQRGEQWW